MGMHLRSLLSMFSNDLAIESIELIVENSLLFRRRSRIDGSFSQGFVVLRSGGRTGRQRDRQPGAGRRQHRARFHT